jgi:hypothetical protein
MSDALVKESVIVRMSGQPITVPMIITMGTINKL